MMELGVVASQALWGAQKLGKEIERTLRKKLKKKEKEAKEFLEKTAKEVGSAGVERGIQKNMIFVAAAIVIIFVFMFFIFKKKK